MCYLGPLGIAAFNLDMNEGTLLLTFDASVISASLDATRFTLVNSISSPTAAHTLTNTSFTISADSAVQVVVLSFFDLNAIKAASNLATSSSDTFLTAMANAVIDVNGNGLTPIDSTSAQSVSVYTEDITPPSLLFWELDLNLGFLTLHFDEIVNSTSFDASGVTLVNSSSSPSVAYTLTDSFAISANSPVLVVLLSSFDLNGIKAAGNLAKSLNNTFLTAMANAVRDMNANSLDPTFSLQVSSYVLDITQPLLVYWELDLNFGSLALLFDETVNSASFDASGFTLVNTTSSPSAAYTLTNTSFTISPNSPNLVVLLSSSDLNTIKAINSLATAPNNAFLTTTTDGVSDLFGNPLMPITQTSAQQVGSFIPDFTPPVLFAWALDLDAGQLLFTFSETVDISTLDPSQITLLAAPESDNAYTLTGYMAVVMTNDGQFTLQLSEIDANSIKQRQGLAISLDSSYLSITSDAIVDTSGNFVEEISRQEPISVSRVIPDISSPVLRSFSLDLNASSLSLTFDEPVDVLTFNLSAFTFSNGASSLDASSLSIPTISPDVSTTVITWSLTPQSLNTITTLVTSLDDILLSVTTYGVHDYNGNRLTPISSTSPLQIRSQDMSPPMLLSWSIDMDAGQLLLTFSETVDITTLDPTQFTLLAAPNSDSAYTLTAGFAALLPTETGVALQMSVADVNEIKARLGLASFLANSYLSITSSAIEDANENAVTPISRMSPLPPLDFLRDTTPPVLLFFALDLNIGLLTLTFDETVDSSSFDPFGFTLINARSSPTAGYTLTNASFSLSTNSPVQEVPFDLNGIQAASNLATSPNNTFLTTLPNAVRDVSGNPIDSTSALQVSVYTEDITQPLLLSWELNLNTGILTLIFTEPVNSSSFNASGFTLANTRSSPSSEYTLTNTSSTHNANSQFLEVILSQFDLNAIKAADNLATSLSNTYLTATANGVRDLNGNSLHPITSLQVFTFVSDQTQPSLVYWELDLNLGSLTLHFDETVNSTSFDASGVTLVNSSSSPSVAYTLTDSFAISANSPVLVVSLSSFDLNGIKGAGNLAKSLNNTFLTAMANAVRDMNANSLFPPPFSLQVSSYVLDLIQPLLVYWELDLNAGIFILTFDETVNYSSFNASAFTLVNTTSSPSVAYTLNHTLLAVNANSPVLVVYLSESDLNAIKAINSLATTENDAFLTTTTDGVSDLFGNPLMPITQTSAQQVGSFIPDFTPPELYDWAIDLNTDQLLFIFSETVDINTLDPSQITLLAAPESDNAYTLTGYTAVVMTNAGQFTLQLSEVDANSIKARQGLAISRDTSFLSITSAAILDTSGNFVVEIPRQSPISASRVISDVSSPVLRSFSLDLDSSSLGLSFDEAVDVATFNASAFTFSNGASSFDASSLTGISIAPAASSAVLVVSLPPQTLNTITTFATSLDDIFLSVTTYGVHDFNGNRLTPISSTSPLQIRSQDTIPPMLLSWSIDMDAGQLLLNFSETVDITTLDPTQFTLLASPNSDSAYTLTAGSAALLPTETGISLQMGVADINEIKARQGLASFQANSYLSITSSAIEDANRNAVTPITRMSPLPPLNFLRDTTPPVLLFFALDLNIGLLTLTFDETVDSFSFNPFGFTLINARSSPTAGYTLTNASFSLSTNSPVQEVLFDLNGIQAASNLATSPNNTFLTILPNAVHDVSGNSLTPIDSTSALQVSIYTEDITQPLLLSWELNLNTGILTLIFIESVNSSSFNASGFTLVNTRSLPSAEYTLTNTSLTLSPNSQVLEVFLSQFDLNGIKAADNLATSTNNTFLTATANGVRDLNGNSLRPISSLQVFTFVSDQTQPSLVYWELDLNLGSLTLHFDETVNSTSFDASGVTLVSSSSSLSVAYTLTNTSFTISANSPVLEVVLSSSDLNAIITNNNIATSINDAFLIATNESVSDLFGNSLRPIAQTSAQQAGSFTLDTTPPLLFNWGLDMDAGQLLLTFSETVDITTLNPTQFTLLAAPNSDNAYTLTAGSAALLPTETGVALQMSVEDINAIKARIGLAISMDSSYLSITSSAVADYSRIPVIAISVIRPLQPSNFFPDETTPVLVSFSLDLNTGQFSLTFDETVNSFNASGFTFIDSIFSPIAAYTLTNTSTISSNTISAVQEVMLSLNDLNSIKLIPDLATSLLNTFLSATSYGVQDVSGNPMTPIPPTFALRATFYASDTVRPMLLNFVLDFDVGHLLLEFSEPVDIRSLDLTQLTLQAAPISDNTYSLTGYLDLQRLPDAVNTLILTLSEADLNAIKSRPGLGSDSSNTYLSVTITTVQDTTRNPLVPTTRIASVFVPDTTPPSLLSFSLDLTTSSLDLTFDETVDVSTFDASAFTFVNRASSFDTSYTLRETTTPPANSAVLEVMLASRDSNGLNAISNLATLLNNTFLTATTYGVSDCNSNNLTPISATSALQATSLTISNISQLQLFAWALNLTSAQLLLTFSETVDVMTLDPTQFTLLAAPNSDNAYSLTGSMTVLPNADSNLELTLQLTSEDSNAIKARPGLARDLVSSYLSITSIAVLDMSGNSVVAIPRHNPLSASLFIEDYSSPVLLSFSFDLDAGSLLLSFDEPVNASSFNVSGFSFVSEASSSDATLTLTGSVIIPVDSAVFVVILSVLDLNAIKAISNLATSFSNTFLTATKYSVSDFNGNLLEPITPTSALQVLDFTVDATQPSLVSWELDLNTGALSLIFDETVNSSSFNAFGLTLTSLSSAAYTLNTSSTSSANSPVLEVILSILDLNSIKETNNLATSSSNSFLTAMTNAVHDMNRNSLNPIASPFALQVSIYTPDTTSPELIYWELDLNVGQLLFAFSEPVAFRILDPSQITLLAAPASDNAYTLTEYMDFIRVNEFEYTIRLSEVDTNAIKVRQGLTSDLASSFLSITSTAFQDTSRNRVMAVLRIDPIRASQFIEDTSSPVLRSFSLDLDAGSLLLSFDETVNASSFIVFGFTFVNRQSSSDVALTLTGIAILPVDSAVFEVMLLDFDLNAIKAFNNLATSPDNTFLTVFPNAVHDMNGNSLTPIDSANALQVSSYTQDTTQPSLLSWDLDLNTGSLSFIFDETVNSTSFNGFGFTLIHTRSLSSASFTLNTSSTSSPNSAVLEVDLSLFDLNGIKATNNLATSPSNSYLTAMTNSVYDMNINGLNPITLSFALQVSTYTPDITNPVLFDWAIDLNTDRLLFTFSETVDISTLDPSQITLLAAPASDNAYTLTGYTAVVMTNAGHTFQFTLQLSEVDANSIKARQGLAISLDSSYLSITSTAILDTSGNPVEAIPRQSPISASEFIVDRSSPVLLSFSLDLNEGSLRLTFDETVNSASFNPSGFTFVNRVSSFDAAYTLTDSVTSSSLTTVLQVILSSSDLNALNTSDNIATSFSNTFLTATMNGIRDVFGNPLAAIASTSALQVTSYNNDTIQPMLVNWEINLNLGSLQLTFTESVDANSFNASGFTIVNSEFSSSVAYTLTSTSTSSPANSAVQVVMLSPSDLNALKAISDLATSESNTFLAVTTYAERDLSGNYLIPVPLSSALQVTTYITDSTPPQLTGFSLNIGTELLMLTFSETVLAATIDITLINLQSASTAPTVSYQLTGGTVVSQLDVGVVVTIQLLADDADALKGDSAIATRRDNTFIWFTPGLVEDPSQIQSLPILSTNALQATDFIADSVPPRLESFTLNLNQRELVLTFDEIVTASTLMTTLITVQSAAAFPTQSVQLSPLSTTASLDGTRLSIDLSSTDFNAIAAAHPLASTIANTYLSLGEGVVIDTSEVRSAEVSFGAALQVANYTADRMPPSLLGFDLDLNRGLLTLEFSEFIDITSFNPTQVTLQSFSGDLTSTDFFHTLRQGGVAAQRMGNPGIVDISLSDNDLNDVKRLTSLATERSNTYLSFTSTTITDTSSNMVIDVSRSAAILTRSYIPDETGPTIVALDLNYDDGSATIFFNEVVNVASFQATGITLQSSSNADGDVSAYTLTDISIVNIDEVPLRFLISNGDLNELKRRRICVTINRCFFSSTEDVIADFSDNQNIPTGTNAVRVRTLVPDRTHPILSGFIIDYENRTVSLTFDEVVDPTTVLFSGITVQNVRNLNSLQGLAFQNHTFTMTGTVLENSNGMLVLTLLLDVDLNALIVNPILGGTVENSFIVLDSGTVMDMSGNPSQRVGPESAIQADRIVQDTSPPLLVYYDLDLIEDLLTMKFSEPVRSDTFDASAITLLSSSTAGATGVTLSQQSMIRYQEFNSLLILMLTESEESEIENPLSPLAKSANTTFLSIMRGAATNFVGLTVESSEALPVRIYIKGKTDCWGGYCNREALSLAKFWLRGQ